MFANAFVRGGSVSLWRGVVRDLGYISSHWSNTDYSETSDVYKQGFDSVKIFPANNYSRANGFSVRCLAL